MQNVENIKDQETTQKALRQFSAEKMASQEFAERVKKILGSRGVRRVELCEHYSYVEYLSAPDGLIILAHQKNDSEQVDGVHPAVLSESIDRPRNIVKELGQAVPYNVHHMTRRSQGSLVLAAFGRMIDGGDKEAPFIVPEGRCWLEVFSSAKGVIVGIHDDDTVHMLSAPTEPRTLERKRHYGE